MFSKLFSLAVFAAAFAFCQDVQSVYILKMGNSFNQYLANNLTNQKVMRVVTDPQKADLILTDRLGEAFQSKLEEIYPPEKPVVEKKDAEKKDGDKDKKEPERQAKIITNMGGGKGTIFLVDRKSRAVTWSTFFTPKNVSAVELNRSARKVVEQMKPGGAGRS